MFADPLVDFTLAVVPVLQSTVFYLFFDRKMEDFPALSRTASFIDGPASFALNEELVAIVIGAIGMCVKGCSALVTGGDDYSVDGFAKAFIEHEIFSREF